MPALRAGASASSSNTALASLDKGSFSALFTLLMINVTMNGVTFRDRVYEIASFLKLRAVRNDESQFR